MKPSDCPYPVGTPEHSNWIRNVLIPAEARDEDIMMAHRERAGIERLGGTVTWDRSDVSPEDELLGVEESFDHNPIVLYYSYADAKATVAFMNDMMKLMRESFNTLAANMQDAVDTFNEEFIKGLQGIIVDDGEAHAQHQKKRKEMCIPHGNPKSSCRKCHRR